MTDRQKLEHCIIGACVIESKYGHIGHILRAKNFSHIGCKLIWGTMEMLWPDHPIDLLTIAHQLRKVQAPHALFTLGEAHASVSSAQHIVHHAFILLETSFQEALIQLLSEALKTTSSMERQSIINICLQRAAQANADVLKDIDTIEAYLRSFQQTDLADQVAVIGQQIDQRTLATKREAHYAHLKNEYLKLKPEFEKAV